MNGFGDSPDHGLGNERGVDAQGRRAATGMAQSTGNGADVDAGRDEFGRRVVAEAVQVRVDAEPLRQPAVPLGHRVRPCPLRAVGRGGEHEPVALHGRVERGGIALGAGPVRAQAVPGAAEGARYTGGEFREERDLDQVHLVLGFPSCASTDPMHIPTQLLSTLLGGGMSSRLFQEIREKRGLVYSVYSFVSPFADHGLFTIYAGTGEDQAEELVPVALQELRRVQADVTEEELARAKAQLRASLLMSLESTGSRCEQLSRQLQVYGRIIPVEETKAKIAAVTVEQVQAVAARMFRAVPTLAALGPAGKVPALPAIAEKLAA